MSPLPLPHQRCTRASFTASGTWEANSGTADPLLFLSNVVASDIDGEHYNNGYVRIDLTNYTTGDQLGIATERIDSGSSILYNGAEKALMQLTTATDAPSSLSSDSVDDALITTLLQQVSFTSSSDNPTRAGTMPTREVTISLNDGGNEGDSAGAQTRVVSPNGANSFNLVGLNAPSFSGLDVNHGTAYIQNGTPLVIDANAMLSDLILKPPPSNPLTSSCPGARWQRRLPTLPIAVR